MSTVLQRAEICDVAEQLSKLADSNEGPWYGLIAGYPASGFVRITREGLELPPEFNHPPVSGFNLRWTLFHDVRAFCEWGEFHAWREGHQWRGRILAAEQVDERDRMKRDYPILGRNWKKARNRWVLRKEDRGPAVWLPEELDRDPDVRPVLWIDQILQQNDVGMYGVVDSMIRRVGRPREEDHE